MIMKRIALIALIAFVAFTTQAQVTDFEWHKKVNKVKATIKFLEDKETAVIVPDGSSSMRYISAQLPGEYKKDGLKVTYSGWLGKIPPNVRMMGSPLKITKICISKAEAKKYDIKKTSYTFKG